MGRKRAASAPRMAESQVAEVLANYDLECAKQLSRIERSAQRHLEGARLRMEARQRKVPQDVMKMTLQGYYDMHATAAGAERGRYMPPLALASMPDAGI